MELELLRAVFEYTFDLEAEPFVLVNARAPELFTFAKLLPAVLTEDFVVGDVAPETVDILLRAMAPLGDTCNGLAEFEADCV